MTNRAFWKAIRLLSHPATLGALALLLVNDHLLRRAWPSWWTGKIGDFAWLFFAPLALAALVAWLVPARLANQEKIVGYTAFGLTGAVFTLAKTWPAFHAAAIGLAGKLLGFPILLQRDPTDLMALGALATSWWLWRRPSTPRHPSWGPGWIALPLAALLTIANSAAPDYGISCLAVVEDRVIAAGSAYWTFVSSDGGLSWQDSEHSDPCSRQAGNGVVVTPGNDRVLFRYASGAAIEKSEDGGQTWQAEFNPVPTSQAQYVYYARTRAGSPHFHLGPLGAVADPATGNVLFAMGHEGVLVRTPDARYTWVPVGTYRREEMGQIGPLMTLLGGEMVVAAGFALLLIGTWAIRLRRTLLRGIVLGLAWALWGVAAFIVPPAAAVGYMVIVPYYLFVAAGAFIVPFGLEYMYRAGRSSPALLGRLAAYALIGAALFFLPYLLWAINAVPEFSMASSFALVLGVLVFFLGGRALRQRLAAAGPPR